MAPLADPERLLAYRDALSNWAFADYIKFKLSEQSRRWIRRELGIRFRELGQLMHEHVASGGQIDEVRETRPEWSGKFEYHYDLRLAIGGTPVYIETRLNFQPPFRPDAAWILVVNVHAP
jgi:hypothetical protein